MTQWRTTPAVADVTGDGLPDLVMLDPEGYLALFERVDHGGGRLGLRPGRRVFVAPTHASFDANHGAMGEDGGPLRLNDGRAGKSGRRKLCLADWDGDGKLDLLVNSQNVNILRQVTSNDRGDTSSATWGRSIRGSSRAMTRPRPLSTGTGTARSTSWSVPRMDISTTSSTPVADRCRRPSLGT